jgi:hypothetical protein
MPEDSGNGRPTLLNCPGLWIAIFAGVGLLVLHFGDEAIQKRMRRHNQRLAPPASTMPAERDSGGDDEAGTDYRPAEVSAAANPYQLTGLRWILTLALVAGLLLLIRTAVSVHRLRQGNSQRR